MNNFFTRIVWQICQLFGSYNSNKSQRAEINFTMSYFPSLHSSCRQPHTKTDITYHDANTVRAGLLSVIYEDFLFYIVPLQELKDCCNSLGLKFYKLDP